MASESLRHLDGQVDDQDADMCSADLHQGTRAERSKSPCSGSGTPTNNPCGYGIDCFDLSGRPARDEDSQGRNGNTRSIQ